MKCPVCQSEEFEEWGRVNQYSIKTCTKCGLGITHPFPSNEEMAHINQETYEVEQRIKTYLLKQKYFEKRYRKYLDRIRRFVSEGRLLDIGCNIGIFLEVARELGYNPTGVEINSQCARFGQEKFGFKVYADYLENIGFESNSFDVITIFDVLEHIPDLTGFLQEVRRILSSGGILVVQSPNLDSLMARITKSKWFWLCPPDHLYHFSPNNLAALLEANGFLIMDVKTWEPTQDFCDNMLAALKPNGFFVRFVTKVLRASRIINLSIYLLKGLWWTNKKGGLVEIYATKSEKAGE